MKSTEIQRGFFFFFVVAWIYKVQLASLGFIGVMPINLHLSGEWCGLF